MTSKAFRRTMMACLCIVLAFMYIPIIAIIGMSFNKTPYGMFPYVFTTQWYKTLFTTSNLLPACILSLKFSFLVTLAAVVIGTLCSYGLQYYAPKWAARFNFVLQLPIIIPWLVTSISLLLMFSFLGSGRGMGIMFLAAARCAAVRCAARQRPVSGYGPLAGAAAPASRGKPAARVF